MALPDAQADQPASREQVALELEVTRDDAVQVLALRSRSVSMMNLSTSAGSSRIRPAHSGCLPSIASSQCNRLTTLADANLKVKMRLSTQIASGSSGFELAQLREGRDRRPVTVEARNDDAAKRNERVFRVCGERRTVARARIASQIARTRRLSFSRSGVEPNRRPHL
jgi:hypothetical protein